MRKKFLNEKGFTLIEVIASLVILTVVGALVIVSTIRIIEGFTIAKMNAVKSQKGHIALSRLTKEFTNITSVTSGNSNSIFFNSRSYIDGTLVTKSVLWAGSGNPLLLNIDPLVDNVSNFELTYYDSSGTGSGTWSTTSKEIGITLTLVGAKGKSSAFTTRVVPRNL
jgi:prepilin-type N-terminal cleavage/methylation domain-containing protein